MEIRIAIPDKSFIQNVMDYREELCNSLNIKLLKVDENKCFELLMNNRVDIALLTPLGYGKGLGNANFMIIPVSAVSLVGYTGLASIYFKKDLKTIDTIATAFPDDFIIKIAALLLAERYGMQPKVIKYSQLNSEIPKNSDAIILYEKSETSENSLDVSEEWFDAYEMPLPYLFWVCKAHENSEKIREVLSKFTGIRKEDRNVKTKDTNESDVMKRKGEIIKEWNDDIENSLDQTLQFLFFHQYFDNIPAVKILGRENEKPPEMKNKEE
jgi:hypothetical protein